MTATQQEQLRQLLTATWDGNLISKTDRDYLVSTGYAQRRKGWNIAAPWGVEVAVNMKLISENPPRAKHLPIAVKADGLWFSPPFPRAACFISHDRICQGMAANSIVRDTYNAWVDASLKCSI